MFLTRSVATADLLSRGPQLVRHGCDEAPRRNVTMNEQNLLAERFEANRAHLRAVAYRMLGSRVEADDAVQEAWLRLGRAEAGAIDNLGGRLTTVVARVCLDMLRGRKMRREEPIGPGVPEPAVTPDIER